MKVSAPFQRHATVRRRRSPQAATRDAGGVRAHSLKITQKILEMHGLFGYNVTIMYSKMYSEL